MIPGNPPTSEIHTRQVQARHLRDPEHKYPWINPTGIEVWGPPVREGPPATGDDAIMFSTNGDWDWDPDLQQHIPRPAVYMYDPLTGMSFPYIMADQIQNAIGDPDVYPDVDGMMIYDQEQDGEFGPGDSIMFTIHSMLAGPYDGGEIWVWNFDDGPFGSATFLNHGGYTWDTVNSVVGIFPNVLTSIEYERILSASGPTNGHVLRPSDDKEPKKIAILQCVGSRDTTAGRAEVSSRTASP